MAPFDELNRQNREIAELSKVLGVLIKDRSMCDTSVFCELFQRFAGKVRAHMELEDRSLYSKLLTHKDREVNAKALRSLNGAREIKRIFSEYTNTWCRNGLDIYNHAAFVRETEDIFRLVTERIDEEAKQLYPLVRALEKGAYAAARRQAV